GPGVRHARATPGKIPRPGGEVLQRLKLYKFCFPAVVGFIEVEAELAIEHAANVHEGNFGKLYRVIERCGRSRIVVRVIWPGICIVSLFGIFCLKPHKRIDQTGSCRWKICPAEKQ